MTGVVTSIREMAHRTGDGERAVLGLRGTSTLG